ncbi:MAG: TonB family protein [Pseudomonadota bacterium]
MQNLSLLLAAALVASTAAAQSPAPAAMAAPPASSGPSFAASDQLPDSLGYNDAYALYEIRVAGEPLSEDQQVLRWQAELNAGRARAGALVGNYLAYRALTPADCAAARDALLKADELGSDQASWALSALEQNQSCGDPDRAKIERWLKKSVLLDNIVAAERLIEWYAPDGSNGDPVQRYIYARVAGGYAEAVAEANDAQPRSGYDAAALQAMEKDLSAADRARATSEATKILEQMLKRHQRFMRVQPVEFTRASAGGKASHEFVASTLDYRHECQWNLRGNCAGAQRLAFVDFTSKSADFMSCKIVLKAGDFAGAAPRELAREFLIGPQAKRTLALGDVNEQPDKKAVAVTCVPVPNLAANAAAGKCRAKLKGTIDVENFYPPAARNNGTEGTAVVRYFVPPGADAASDAEIMTSSGDATLDDAALATIRSGKYTNECAYGLSTIRIAFKLSN